MLVGWGGSLGQKMMGPEPSHPYQVEKEGQQEREGGEHGKQREQYLQRPWGRKEVLGKASTAQGETVEMEAEASSPRAVNREVILSVRKFPGTLQ